MSGIPFFDQFTLLIMAFAVGLDAFSVSLSLSMQHLRRRQIFLIGILFGFPHILLPLFGLLLGQTISAQIGHYTIILGSLLLIMIGVLMIFESFNYESKRIYLPTKSRLLILALTVSLDSFPVGLSLGMSGAQIYLTLLLFGLSTTCLTWIGLVIGRRVHRFLGVYSEMFGGSVLSTIGLYMLFGS